jgi:hypothetical protein
MEQIKNNEPLTSYIKHLAVSGLSSISARIKSSCNLTGKCFEMPNVSYTYPLAFIVEEKIRHNENLIIFVEKVKK